MNIELTIEEHSRVVYALQQQALREATIALDLRSANVISPLYANLAEKVRQQGKEQTP